MFVYILYSLFVQCTYVCMYIHSMYLWLYVCSLDVLCIYVCMYIDSLSNVTLSAVYMLTLCPMYLCLYVCSLDVQCIYVIWLYVHCMSSVFMSACLYVYWLYVQSIYVYMYIDSMSSVFMSVCLYVYWLIDFMYNVSICVCILTLYPVYHFSNYITYV